jgi:hypothetical protein
VASRLHGSAEDGLGTLKQEPASSRACVFQLLILLCVLSETVMINELKDATDLDKDVIQRYNGAERGREAWLQDQGRTDKPASTRSIRGSRTY